MAKANCLADLLRIRDANSALIDRLDGNLGSALGYKVTKKKQTKTPAVIIFVPSKVNATLLPANQQIPKTLKGPDGLECPTDVVVGRKAVDEPPPPPLDASNAALIEELQGGNLGLIGGVQLGFFESDGGGYVGTAACAVRRKSDGRAGLLTNQHVGGPSGRVIYQPDPGNVRIGHTRASFEMDPDEYYFDGLIDEEDAYYRIDCAFVEVLDAALPLVKTGLYRLGSIGEPIALDLKTMGPLGRSVVSIGRTRGIQRGTIMAFAYEWSDDPTSSVYTDYLVIGEKGKVFSDHGDSGKLIVTDDAKRNAVALLWGGWSERLRRGHGQENWTYAIDINKALHRLEVEIITDGANPPGPSEAARARAKEVARKPR
jgi:hypothetical protein